MNDEPELGARLEIVAHRVEFLEFVDEEGPVPPRDIVDALPYSRPTVTRALKELREADLVEKRDDGYTPTLAGVLATEEYRRYETASKAILDSEDLLAAIPKAQALPVTVLTGADTILADTDIPVRALEAVSDLVRRADRVRAYLPTLVNTHLLRVWHRTVVGSSMESEILFEPELLTVLKGQYPHLLSEMAAADGFSAFATDGPSYGVLLTTTGDTTTTVVIVYENDTAVRGILTNESTDAVDWARAELDRLGTDATDVTADLDALGAAVADGLAVPYEPRSGESRRSKDASAQSTDGHPLPIDLEAEGFVRLSQEYFDAHGRAAPAVGWRTGFTLAEVRSGQAVDHLDDEERNVTDNLVERLLTGTDHVVLGPPGAGKSTICMAVACAWFDRELGPVLYRERGEGDQLQSASVLEAYLRQTDGHALVVVEDAVRDEANAIFAVMQTLDAAPSVTFLLDSRTHEWHNPDPFELDARRDAYRRTELEEYTVPALTERDCERFVARFSDLVGADIDLSGEELFEMVEEGTAAATAESLPAGDALVAQYYLVRRYDPPIDSDASEATALDEAAGLTYQTLADAEVQLALDLATLVALLTAAGVPVALEYLYAVAATDEYSAVDEAVELLEGEVLFDWGQPTVGTTAYRTRHEAWAMRFLEQAVSRDREPHASERFGRCVTRLLALADDPSRRTRIQRYLSGRTPHIHRIDADPQGWADELLERIFDIGQTNASLAPLFGETANATIELPDACSGWTRIQQAYWRGEMNRIHGNLGRAEREYCTLVELAETVEIDDDPSAAPAPSEFASTQALSADDVASHRTRWCATGRTALGLVARDRGEFETAMEYHREALGLFNDIDDREGEMICLKNLGTIAFYQGDYEQAQAYSERGLATAQDLEASVSEAACLRNLGAIATKLSDYETGQEYFERAYAIARDIGDRYEEASRLNNLGVIAHHRGAYDQARECCTQSLALFRELGDQKEEANSLNNLGESAQKQDAYDQSREYHEQSLAIRREIGHRSGEATSLVNLGAIDLEQGNYDRAREYLDQALTVYEAIDEPNGIAEVRQEQGRLALAQGAIEEAHEHAQAAHDTFEELGATVWRGRSLRLLGRVAAAENAPAEARSYWQAALEAFETVSATPDALVTLEKLVETCSDQGAETQAKDWWQRARDIAADAPEPTAVQHRDWIEGHAAELDEA